MPIVTITMDQIMKQVGSLAPVSRVLQRALQIINDPDSNMIELAKVIKLDQAMTGLILRWVNSGYYSLTKSIGTIEQAVAFLGFKTVQDLVMTASVSGMMNRQVIGYALEKGDLWKHSIGTAAGAQLLIKDIAPEKADETYYCGLFCDVGKLAFDHLMQTTIPRVKLEDVSNYSFDQVEKGLFGFSHAEVGAALVRRWNFPEEFAHVIEFHHTPGSLEPGAKLVGYAVHVADAVMSMFGVGIGRDSMQYVIDPTALDVLKWKEDSFENFYNRIIPLVDEAEAFLHRPQS